LLEFLAVFGIDLVSFCDVKVVNSFLSRYAPLLLLLLLPRCTIITSSLFW